MKRGLLAAVFLAAGLPSAAWAQTVSPAAKGEDPSAGDQDDMCFWIHPSDGSRSTMISSDKDNRKIFVYDNAGKTVQAVDDVGKPGNIDLRYGFPLGKRTVDIVAFNDRDASKIRVYRVEPETRMLSRVDDGKIRTGENYGFALYHSRKTGKFYGLTTSKRGNIEQYELRDDGSGRVRGVRVRAWRIGKTEAAVFDDGAATLFIAGEEDGIWRLGAEPDAPTPGKLIVKPGEHGTKEDFEGITIYHLPGGKGYLIQSSQGNDRFAVFDLKAPYAFRGLFSVSGAGSTDGIDVTNVNIGGSFTKGCFALHDGGAGNLMVKWEEIARRLDLKIDTTWSPRRVGRDRKPGGGN